MRRHSVNINMINIMNVARGKQAFLIKLSHAKRLRKRNKTIIMTKIMSSNDYFEIIDT